VVSNLLLWEKAASIPECQTGENGCSDPLVITFKNALQRAEVINILADKMHEEFVSISTSMLMLELHYT
jgi:prolactin